VQQCPSCRELVEIANRFCSSCGSPMPVPPPVQMMPPAPISNFPPQAQPFEYVPPFVKEPRKPMSGKTKKIIAGALSLLLVGSIAGVVVVKVNAPKIFAETLSVDEQRQVTARMCNYVLGDIQWRDDFYFARVVPSRIRSLNNVTGDYWDTKDFKAKNNSWFYRTSSYDVIQENITTSIKSHAAELFAGYSAGKYSKAYTKNSITWNIALFDSTTSECSFKKELQALLNYDNALLEAKNVLANAPWYPRGFSEFSDYPGIAYKPYRNYYCSYSFGTCARFQVISNSSCQSNLYIQANLLVGGTVVDWGNDSLSLGAYQIGEVEITFTEDYSGTYEVTAINCRP